MTSLLPSTLARGFEARDAWRGVIRREGIEARVVVETRDRVRIEADVPPEDAPSPRAALTANGRLPLDLRFARRAGGLTLVADTALGREDDLERILEGIVRALRGGDEDPPAGEEPRLDAAFRDLQERGQDVVSLDGGHELRPRLRDEVVPVRLRAASGRAELQLAILERLPARPAGDAVADLCLRVNDRLRGARLALHGRALLAETRLSRARIDADAPAGADALAGAARAVAAASLAVREGVALLCRCNRVAQGYAEILLTPEPEAPASAGDERR